MEILLYFNSFIGKLSSTNFENVCISVIPIIACIKCGVGYKQRIFVGKSLRKNISISVSHELQEIWQKLIEDIEGSCVKSI